MFRITPYIIVTESRSILHTLSLALLMQGLTSTTQIKKYNNNLKCNTINFMNSCLKF